MNEVVDILNVPLGIAYWSLHGTDNIYCCPVTDPYAFYLFPNAETEEKRSMVVERVVKYYSPDGVSVKRIIGNPTLPQREVGYTHPIGMRVHRHSEVPWVGFTTLDDYRFDFYACLVLDQSDKEVQFTAESNEELVAKIVTAYYDEMDQELPLNLILKWPVYSIKNLILDFAKSQNSTIKRIYFCL